MKLIIFFSFVVLSLVSCSGKLDISLSKVLTKKNDREIIVPAVDGSVAFKIVDEVDHSSLLKSCQIEISRDNIIFSSGICSNILTNFSYDQNSSAINWKAGFGDYGVYSFLIVMTVNGEDREIRLSLELKNRNTIPQIMNTANITINQGQNFELLLVGYDPDIATQSDVLTYSCKTCPSGMTLDASHFVRLASASIVSSPFRFTIEVSDLFGGVSEKEFTVTVDGFSGGGQNPTGPIIPKYTVEEGSSFFLPYTTIYPEGTSSTVFTHSCQPACPGAFQQSGMGYRRFAWTPNNFTNGVYLIAFGINENPEFSYTIELTVTDKNWTPEWGVFSTSLREFFNHVPAQDINFPVTDQEGDNITLSCYVINLANESVVTELSSPCSSLNSIVFSSVNKKMSVEVDPAETGAYKVLIVATDGSSKSQREFPISLVNQVPLDIVVRIASDNLSYLLPIQSSADAIFVDWGAGGGFVKSSAYPSYTYTTAGDYNIKVYGRASRIQFGDSSALNATRVASRDRLIQVNSLGDLGYTSLTYAFYRCANLETFSSGVISASFNRMDYLFREANKLKEVDLNGFNASAVTNANGGASFMFSTTPALEEVKFLGSNFQGISQFGNMFSYSGIQKADFENLNLTAAVDMSYFLYGADYIEAVNFSGKNFASLTNITEMFRASGNLTIQASTSFNFSNASFPLLTSLNRLFFERRYSTINFSNTNFPLVASLDEFARSTAGDVIDFRGANFSSVNSMYRAFRGAGQSRRGADREILYLSNVKMPLLTNMEGLFQLNGLKEIYLDGFEPSKTANLNLANFFNNPDETPLFLDLSFLVNRDSGNIDLASAFGSFSGVQDNISLNLALPQGGGYISLNKSTVENGGSFSFTSGGARVGVYCDYGANGFGPFGDFFGLACLDPADF